MAVKRFERIFTFLVVAGYKIRLTGSSADTTVLKEKITYFWVSNEQCCPDIDNSIKFTLLLQYKL